MKCMTTDGMPCLILRHDHPVTRSLRALRLEHRLSGAVLLTFDAGGEHVSVTSSAATDEFGAILARVADMLLAKFNAGEFDAALPEGCS